MSAEIKVLGLGFSTFGFRKFQKALGRMLASRNLSYEIQRVSKGMGEPKKKWLDALIKKQPDLLLVDLDSFKSRSQFWELMGQYRWKAQGARPAIYLFTQEIPPLDRRNPISLLEFYFREYGPLVLDDYSQLLTKGEPRFLEVKPTPRLIAAPGELLELEGMIRLERLSKIVWQDQEFDPAAFVRAQAFLHKDAGIVQNCQALWFNKEKVLLRTGFGLEEMVYFASLDQDGERYEALLPPANLMDARFHQRLAEKAVSLALDKVIASIDSLEHLKNIVPIQVVAPDGVVAKMICYHLKQEGFKQVVWDQQPPHALKLLLSPIALGENDFYLALHQDPIMRELGGLEDFEGEYLRRPLPPKQEMNLDEIQRQQGELREKLKKLFEKQRSLAGRRAMQRQEKQLNQNSIDKLQLLSSLAKRAEEPDMSARYGGFPEAVIFFSDSGEASSFARNLTITGRKFFVDFAEIQSLDKIEQFASQHLQNFPVEGRVFSLVSKGKLVNQIKGMQERLAPLDLRELDQEEKLLEEEGTALDAALDNLMYLAYWNLTQDLVRIHLAEIYDAVRRAQNRIFQSFCEKLTPQSVTLFSLEGDRKKPLCELVRAFFPQSKELQIHFLNRSLQFHTRENSPELRAEALMEANVRALGEFFYGAMAEISKTRPDHLILDLPLPLAINLVRHLHERPDYAALPLWLVIRHSFSAPEISELAKSGVHMIHEDTVIDDMAYQAHALRRKLDILVEV